MNYFIITRHPIECIDAEADVLALKLGKVGRYRDTNEENDPVYSLY
jgi:hypothetical protein